VAVLALTAAGRSAAFGAQASGDPMMAWRQAVWSHTPGEADAPLATVAGMPPWRILNALQRRDVGEDRVLLTRALVLHTDLAIVQREAAEQRGATDAGSGAVVLEDGHSTGRRQRSPHWAVAQEIAATLARQRDDDARRVALLWFRTVNALFLHWADGTLRYVDGGLVHYPDDARLHLYRGTVHQMFADGRVQQFLSGGAAGRLRVRDDLAVPGSSAGRPRIRVTAAGRGVLGALRAASIELARAEASLRRALELEPTLAEAGIRLAHVVGERGHPDEAITLAQGALGARLPPFFESYATLVLGRNLARAGRYEEARTAFDRAAILAPTAQAPRIGQSQVALAAGRPADALSALTGLLGPERPVPAETEEWAIYFRVHDPVAAIQLAALRAEVR
jgi:tetratricopeptide (TPR) repeat protein